MATVLSPALDLSSADMLPVVNEMLINFVTHDSDISATLAAFPTQQVRFTENFPSGIVRAIEHDHFSFIAEFLESPAKESLVPFLVFFKSNILYRNSKSVERSGIDVEGGAKE